MIEKCYKINFNTLTEAFKNNDVLLMECTDKVTGKKVVTICAYTTNTKTEEVEFLPLAKLFDGNPYEELLPPE